MVKETVKDVMFLSQKAEKATEKDKYIAKAYERCTCNEASKIWQQYD